MRASGVVASPETLEGIQEEPLCNGDSTFLPYAELLRVSAPPHHAFSGGQRDGANPSARAEERPAWEAGLFRGIRWLIRTPNASWNASSGMP